jgi:hypothetical protein
MSRSTHMGRSGGSVGGGGTSVTTQRNVTVRTGHSFAVGDQPHNRTTVIHKWRPADRYVILHKRHYYGYAPSSSSTTIINRDHRGGYAAGGVSSGSARIGTRQTTTTTTRTNAGAGANGQSAANVNRNAGGHAGGMGQSGNQGGQSANKSPSSGNAPSPSNAGGNSAH